MKKEWQKPVRIAIGLALVMIVVSVLNQPALPVAASPGLTFYSGFEHGDFTEWDNLYGTVSVESTTVKTGNYALRVNPSGDDEFIRKPSAGSPSRLTFHLYIATAPNKDCSLVGYFGDVSVYLSIDRKLQLRDGGLKDTGTTQLSLSTWYRISLSLDAANNRAKVYLDGVEECSSDDITGNSIDNCLGSAVSATTDLYFDNYATDDIASTDDIGDIRVVRSQPNAMGTYTGEWQQVPSSTNHYEKIDECPADDGDYTWAEANGTQLDESYGLEDCSDLGLAANETIKAIPSVDK